jgi:hypothetical protein
MRMASVFQVQVLEQRIQAFLQKGQNQNQENYSSWLRFDDAEVPPS